MDRSSVTQVERAIDCPHLATIKMLDNLHFRKVCLVNDTTEHFNYSCLVINTFLISASSKTVSLICTVSVLLENRVTCHGNFVHVKILSLPRPDDLYVMLAEQSQG